MRALKAKLFSKNRYSAVAVGIHLASASASSIKAQLMLSDKMQRTVAGWSGLNSLVPGKKSVAWFVVDSSLQLNAIARAPASAKCLIFKFIVFSSSL